MARILPHPDDDDDDREPGPEPMAGGGWISGSSVGGPDEAPAHRPWCDPARHAEVGYCLGGRELTGKRMVTKVVVEHATRTLVVVEQYSPDDDVEPEAVVAWDAGEARRVWTMLGELLDLVEAES